jgi:hypothetical protein
MKKQIPNLMPPARIIQLNFQLSLQELRSSGCVSKLSQRARSFESGSHNRCSIPARLASCCGMNPADRAQKETEAIDRTQHVVRNHLRPTRRRARKAIVPRSLRAQPRRHGCQEADGRLCQARLAQDQKHKVYPGEGRHDMFTAFRERGPRL